MQRYFLVLLAMLTMTSLTLGQRPESTGKNVNRDPDATQLNMSDVKNFWRAYDLAASGDKLDIFQREYLDKGSIGLKSFSEKLFPTGQVLVTAIQDNASHYASVRDATLKVETFREPIRASFRKLKSIYPDAVFPDVYFLIGAMNSGGGVSDDGLLIGVEVYGKHIEDVPYIVAHELIHYQQKYPGGLNLLGQSIKEGSADFVGELISGKSINRSVMEYADLHERALWESFKKEMNGTDYGAWLYNTVKAKERGMPKNVGYYIGYRITESYYKRAADKRQALTDIFKIEDFSRFLKASRYEEKFDGGTR